MILFVLGLFGVLVHSAGREIRHFESLAASDIRSQLRGEKPKVSVRTELRGAFGSLGGDLRGVTISARDFQTDGLPLFTESEHSKRGHIGELKIILNEFQLGALR